MAPMADFLQLKTSVDLEPTSPEDKALLLVDQVRCCFSFTGWWLDPRYKFRST